MRTRQPFPTEELERSRRYHRPLYALLVLDTTLGLGVLAVLAFVVPLSWARGLGWAGGAAAVAALTTVGSSVLRLPGAAWRHRRDRTWGLTRQGFGGWASDRAKALAIGTALTAAPLVALVWLARTLPSAWPAAAAGGAAFLVLLLGFVAPVVLEPVFNRFRPLEGELADSLLALAERAGVRVREVLVADASRRTTRHNAYVSGLGRTRRVVIWDTLLRAASPAVVAVVVAHELGHRRHRHVAVLTVLGMAGAAAFVLILWALPIAVADPAQLPRVVLAGALLQLAALPFLSGLSRLFERQADRFALEQTGDPEAFERAFLDLASANVADLEPPRLLYLWLFSHPTPGERIAMLD